jgi:hypothetical protein
MFLCFMKEIWLEALTSLALIRESTPLHRAVFNGGKQDERLVLQICQSLVDAKGDITSRTRCGGSCSLVSSNHTLDYRKGNSALTLAVEDKTQRNFPQIASVFAYLHSMGAPLGGHGGGEHWDDFFRHRNDRFL